MADRVSVLHVDDDPQLLDVVSTYFEKRDGRFSVESAEDAHTALAKLEESSFDCIVADYAMEPTDGIELLERVREDHPDLPFLLFTMRGNEQVASDAIEAGATDYVLKRGGTDQFDLLANRVLNAVEQFRTKETARENQRRLAELAEAIPDALCIYSSDWEELLFVNSAAENVFGVPPESLYDRPLSFLDGVHPDDRDRVRATLDRLPETGEIDVECRVTTDDDPRWIRIVAHPVHDDNDEIGRIVTTASDVTGRKRRERDLQELKERYRAYVENASDLITVIDTDGTVTYQSPSVEQVLGYDQGALIGENAFEYVHPQDRDYVIDQFETLQQRSEGTTVSAQFRMQRADGTWLRIESVATNRTESTIDGYVVTSRDISEQERRERTLRALHTAAQEIADADKAATVYEILIETAEEVLEFDLVAVDVEHDGALIQEAWTLDLDDGDYYDRTDLESDDTFAVRAYNRQETIVVDDLRDTDISPADSEYRSALTVPIGTFGTFQAVSRSVDAFDHGDVEFAEQLVGHVQVKLDQLEGRQALEERTAELQRQNKRLDEFVSVVSHDLRNPVTVAQGRVELLQEQLDDEHLDEIEWAVDRMETLIEELLTLARHGAEVDELEPVDVGTLLENCWRTVETADATLVIETDRTIMGDPDRCRQLIENLFRNAVEHGGKGVTITVGDIDGGIYIEDDGPGIPEDHRDKVFETGYSTTENGTGFGLNIVRQIATAHDWGIQATEGNDGGARFEITGMDIVDTKPAQ